MSGDAWRDWWAEVAKRYAALVRPAHLYPQLGSSSGLLKSPHAARLSIARWNFDILESLIVFYLFNQLL